MDSLPSEYRPLAERRTSVPRIILIGGGSSSGKSFLTREVLSRLGEGGITHLTLDDYYKDQTSMSMEERLKVNYDHPRAFDWKLMREQVAELKQGKTVQKPIYDFVERNRSKKSETIIPQKLIVIEGIMALVDRQLREMGDLRVFISASAERRFLRRLIRDSEQRGREFENIVHQYFTTVQPMYEEVVKPSSNYADLIINNDGVENLALDVLTLLFQKELDLASLGQTDPKAEEEEFKEEVLSTVFQRRGK